MSGNCMWCKFFEAKTIEPKPGHPDTEFKCNNPKGLYGVGPGDSCDYWELDEDAANHHDEAAHDIWAQEQALREGDG